VEYGVSKASFRFASILMIPTAFSL
jgi:hypothetical protein